MADIPIWKDHFSDLGTTSPYYFRIRFNSTTIYQGKAFRPSSSGHLYVRVNDIIADYIAQQVAGVPVAAQSQFTFPASFTVQKSSNGSSWTTVETLTVTDDWSYDTGFSGSTDGMAFPITGRVDLRQGIFQTRYASGSVTAACKYGSTSRNVTLSLQTGSGTPSYLRSLLHAGAGFVKFDCAANATYSGKTLTEVTIGLAKYTVSKSCARYSLLYKNPYGGYDQLLIEGAAHLKRSVVRDTFKADYDNTEAMRETWDFQNEVTRTYEMNTGLLTEDESSRMPFLLDSPDVYLNDLTAPSVFIPALIVTDSYAFQDVNQRGARMRNHTFEIQVAQNEYRR
jgi:hypothetical protein